MTEHSLGPNGGQLIIRCYFVIICGIFRSSCAFLNSVFLLFCSVGLVYCMDYLEKNIDWLEAKLKPLLKGSYILLCLQLFSMIILVSKPNSNVSYHLSKNPGHPPGTYLGSLLNFSLSLAYHAINCADHYLLFDFPGQVELFFLHSNAKGVIMKLINKLNLRV